ncbi:MAG: kelch repeat-containing protein [Ilumatobacter sp.]
MTNGWRAIPVDYALAVRPADDPQVPENTEPGEPIRISRAGEVLSLRVWFRSDTGVPRGTFVRLVGLVGRGEPSIIGLPIEDEARPAPGDPASEWHSRTYEFQLPDTIHPGRTDAVINWLAPRPGEVASDPEVLAVGELPVVVDDGSKVELVKPQPEISGLLSASLDLALINRGSAPVVVSLDSHAPSNEKGADRISRRNRSPRLTVRFRPQILHLGPGDERTVRCDVQRKARWYGAPQEHIVDITATAASGSIAGTTTFRQRAVIPSWLPKVLAIVALLVLAVLALTIFVHRFVGDSPEQRTWQALPSPDISARTDQTATWVDFTRPDRSGFAGVIDDVLGRSDDRNSVIVWGGRTVGGNLLADGAMFSDDDGEWTSIEALQDSEARYGHTAAWTGTHLVVWGGYTNDDIEAAESGRPSAESVYYGAAYDPLADRWIALPPSGLSPRVGHSMIWTGDALIVFGGVSPQGDVLGDGGVLRAGPVSTEGQITAPNRGDLTNGVWSRFQAGELGTFAAAPRAFHAATFDGTYMVVSGGIGPATDEPTNALLADVYAFDLQRNQWSTFAPADFEQRACHQMVSDDGKVAVLGGLKTADILDDDRSQATPSGTGIALNPDFCTRARSLDRPDPAAFGFELGDPSIEPGPPSFTWTHLANAPDRLGANFLAAETDSGIGLAIPVASIDGIVPLRYTADKPISADRLASTGTLGYRSRLIATWDPVRARLLVWGGLGPACVDPPLRTDRALSSDVTTCYLADGARIDVGNR